MRIAGATVGFALLHSFLASGRVKRAVEARAGARARNGLYRLGYNAQAVATSAALAVYIARQPNREWYRLTGPAALLMRLGQLGGVLMLVDAARRVGIAQIGGFSSAGRLLRGDAEVPAEPEGQGPSRGPDGRVNDDGPFRWSRHPLNFAPLPVLWLNPRMTRNLAVFSALATAYFVLGSVHEEARLKAAYGTAYRAYLRSGVPFYLPAVGSVRLRPRGDKTRSAGARTPSVEGASRASGARAGAAEHEPERVSHRSSIG